MLAKPAESWNKHWELFPNEYKCMIVFTTIISSPQIVENFPIRLPFSSYKDNFRFVPRYLLSWSLIPLLSLCPTTRFSGISYLHPTFQDRRVTYFSIFIQRGWREIQLVKGILESTVKNRHNSYILFLKSQSFKIQLHTQTHTHTPFSCK